MDRIIGILILVCCSVYGATPLNVPPRVGGMPVTQEYDVQWWGAKFDNGVTLDNTTAINDAITYVNSIGGGVVRFPTGTARITGTITLLDKVTIKGAGPNASIIDATANTGKAMFGEGTLTALPTIFQTVTNGVTNVVFAMAHGLSVGDIFILSNTTSDSFSDFINRDYKDGQYFTVNQVVNTTNVAVIEPAYTNFVSGTNILCWKMNPIHVQLKDFGMRFKAGGGGIPNGVQVTLSDGLVAENLDLRGSQYGQLYGDRAKNALVKDCHFFDNQTVASGNYGVVFSNSQDITIDDVYGQCSGPLISFGDAPNDGAVPCRNLTVKFGNHGRTMTSAGVNFHGNCEYYKVIGVTSQGIELGGDNFQVIGGYSGNSEPNFQGITTSEVCGMNGLISGIHVAASHSFDNGLCTFLARNGFTRKSTLRFVGCTFDGGAFSGSGYPSSGTTSLLRIGCVVITNNVELTAVVDNCEFRTSVTTPGPYYGIFASTTTTNGFYQLIVRNPVMHGCGILGSGNVVQTMIYNPIIEDALQHGISVPVGTASFTNEVQIRGGYIQRSQQDGVNIIGDTNLTSWDCQWLTSVNNGITTNHYDFAASNAKNVTYGFNKLGSTMASPTESGIDSITGAIFMNEGVNQNVGAGINSLTFARSSITFDFPIKMVLGAPGSSGTNNPVWIQQNENDVIVPQLRNEFAGSLAGAQLHLVANAASGDLGIWSSNYGIPRRTDRFGIASGSDATALLLESGSSRIDFYSSTTLAGQVNGTNWTFTGGAAADTVKATNGVTALDVTASTLTKFDSNKKLASATAGTDYPPVTTSTNVLKADGAGGFTNAVNGVDIYRPMAASVIYVEDEFLDAATSTLTGYLPYTVTVNSGQYATVAGQAGHPGLKQFSTLSSSVSAPVISTYTSGMNFGTDAYEVGWLIQTPAALSDGTDTYMIMAGFGDSTTSTLSVDAAYIVYKHDINSGKWTGVTSNNSVTNVMTGGTGGTTMVISTWYFLQTKVNAAGTQVDFYVNGVLIGSSTAQIPTTNSRALGGFLQITKSGSGTTARTMLVDYYYHKINLATPRF